MLNLGTIKPKIHLAGNLFNAEAGRIFFEGRLLFEIRKPEKSSPMWRLSADLCDASGSRICIIRDNELWFSSSNADIEQQSSSFKVKDKNGQILLDLQSVPPHGISIDQYQISMGDGVCKIGKQTLPDPFHPGQSKIENVIEFKSATTSLIMSNGGFTSDENLYLSFVNGALKMSAKSG